MNVPSGFAAAQPAMDTWADYYSLPRSIVYGLVWQESAFNPSALGDGGVAYGLTQVHYTTAQGVGYTGSPAGLFDPDTNLQFGLAYLAQQLARYGDMNSALSAYNAGRAITSNSAYVNNILQHAAQFDAAANGDDVALASVGASGDGSSWWLGALALGVGAAMLLKGRK